MCTVATTQGVIAMVGPLGSRLMRTIAVAASGLSVLAGCGQCACSPAPSGQATPWPVSADAAAKAAGAFIGSVDPIPEGADDAGGRRVYVFRASGRSATALVDGDSGGVLEIVLHDLLPGPSGTLEPESVARAAAGAYLDAHGIPHAALPARTGLTRVAGAAAYELSFSAEPAVPGRSDLAIEVDASAGRVFAFADLRSGPGLALPLIGRDVAGRLALAAIPTAGEQILSADLEIGFTAAGDQTSAWMVGLGVPEPGSTDVVAHGAYVSVDARTGAVTIVKQG